jgi:ABC-type sugar transport system ATPase subunit
VLRDGALIGTVAVADTDSRDWVKMMVGRDLDQLFPKSEVARGAESLRVRNLSNGKLRDVSFSAHAGEILGVAGLVGSGRSSLARTLFGAPRRLHLLRFLSWLPLPCERQADRPCDQRS